MLSKNEIHAIAFRGIQAVALFLCLRFIVAGYGPAVYGYVSLVLSFAAYLIIFDFGVVSYVRTIAARQAQLEGANAANPVLLAGFKSLIKTGGLVYVFFAVAIISTDGPASLLLNLLKQPDFASINLIRNSLLYLLFYAALCAAGNLLMAGLSATGKQYRYYRAMIIGAAIQVVTCYWAVAADAPIDHLIGAMLISGQLPMIPILVGALTTSAKAPKTHGPSAANKTTLLFFLTQLGGLITNNVDTLLVAHFFTLHDVANYTTLKLIIQLPISLHGNYMLQSWPLFARFGASMEYIKLKRLFDQKLKYTIIFGFLTSLCIWLASGPFALLWSKGEITLQPALVDGFAIMAFVYLYSACYATFCFSQNYVAPFAALAVITLPILYYLASFGVGLGIGPVSIVIANIFMNILGLMISVKHYSRKVSIATNNR